MPDPNRVLVAATTTADPIPGKGAMDLSAAAIEAVPGDLANLLQHMAAVMPASDLVFGGVMLAVIMLAHATGVRTVTTHVLRRTEVIMRRPEFWRADLLMVGVVFALLALHVVEMFLWVLALVYSGLVPDWRTAGFFVGNTYTTVGYGAFVLPVGWHMLAPIIAMSGLFAFGWSGSLLVDYVRRCNEIKDAAEAARAARKSAAAKPSGRPP